jgi:hypothetical protein
MTDTNAHNGWTNYATWRVNLEMFDGLTADDIGIPDDADAWVAGKYADAYAHDFMCDHCENNILQGWLGAFLSDVDWNEIGQHLIDNR